MATSIGALRRWNSQPTRSLFSDGSAHTNDAQVTRNWGADANTRTRVVSRRHSCRCPQCRRAMPIPQQVVRRIHGPVAFLLRYISTC
jgi:hypothetical protein